MLKQAAEEITFTFGYEQGELHLELKALEIILSRTVSSSNQLHVTYAYFELLGKSVNIIYNIVYCKTCSYMLITCFKSSTALSFSRNNDLDTQGNPQTWLGLCRNYLFVCITIHEEIRIHSFKCTFVSRDICT